MAKTKHGIFRDMSASSFDDMGGQVDQEQEQTQMSLRSAQQKPAKPKKAM